MVLLALPCQADSSVRLGTWQGVNLIVETGRSYSAQFDALRELGANDVALVVLCAQSGTDLTCPTSPSDLEWRTLLDAARARGLRVMFKPHVETNEFSWRGEIRFRTEAEWRAWFENYTQMLTRFARLNPDALCIGTELAAMNGRAADWRNVIQQVRAVYHGPLVYGAHFDEFEKIRWWDALDAVGVDAYFPLDVRFGEQAPRTDGRTVTALREAWQPYYARLDAFARSVGKPILFTEAGYQSRPRSFMSPWQTEPAEVDMRAQAMAYEALFETFEGAPWWSGALWWDWHADDPAGATGFTPALKPAEGVLLAHWRMEK